MYHLKQLKHTSFKVSTTAIQDGCMHAEHFTATQEKIDRHRAVPPSMVVRLMSLK